MRFYGSDLVCVGRDVAIESGAENRQLGDTSFDWLGTSAV